jgi:hypothetical protein
MREIMRESRRLLIGLIDFLPLLSQPCWAQIGSWVRVVNLRNRRSLVVRINDRGPFVTDRIIDLSERAARDLDMIGQGVAQVRLERVAGP